MTAERPPYVITTDQARLDIDAIWGWLRDTYWAKGVPRDVVERSVRNSLSFGVLDGERQVGFARVVTDRATFGWIADVFIEPRLRGRGLARWLVQEIMAHPELRALRRWMLGTRDAHPLYAQLGFRPLAHPEVFMEIRLADPYGAGG
jgi:GNAT superfamily N-acetyltransferase